MSELQEHGDFVAYHNTEGMNRKFAAKKFKEGASWSWSTGKRPERFVGGRIWCISAEGKVRQYQLHGWLEALVPIEYTDGTHRFGIEGTVRCGFWPPVNLNDLPWFSHFVKSQSNFSLGLNSIKDEFVAELEALVRRKTPARVAPGETVPVAYELLLDGKPLHGFVKRYRRNQKARLQCIEYYGTECAICKFDFSSEYGGEIKALVHVHHLQPLATISKEHQLDPIRDLRPVCPNCHVALHSREPLFSIEELAELRKRRRKRTKH